MTTALARKRADRRPASRFDLDPEPLPAPGLTDLAAVAELAGPIYDCALDPAQWRTTLGLCRDFVVGYAASIFSKGYAEPQSGIFHEDGRISPHFGQLYFQTYSRLDPFMDAHVLAPIGRPVASIDVMTPSELYDTRLFREWAEPQGLVDFISAPIEKAGAQVTMFGVFRHRDHGPADDRARMRMSLLLPHIRRAVLIGRVIEGARLHAEALSTAFDGLAAGAFVLDVAGLLLHANSAGRELLRRGGPLALSDGALVATARSDIPALAALVAGADPVSVSLHDEAEDVFVAHRLPLRAEARAAAGLGANAATALFVHRATVEVPFAPEVIARTYGLTHSELRVMLAVVEVGGIPEIAERLGVAETTAKTHLHHVFAKTGTSRQADLVRLVGGFAGPLARPAAND